MPATHTDSAAHNGQDKPEPMGQAPIHPERMVETAGAGNVALLTQVTQYIDAHLQEARALISLGAVCGIVLIGYGLGWHIHYYRNEDVPESEFTQRAKLKAVVTQVKRPYQPITRPPGTELVALEGPLLPMDTMPTPSLLQMTSPGRTLLVVKHVSPMSRLMRMLGRKEDARKGSLEVSVCGVKTEAGASEWLSDHLVGKIVNLQLIAPDRGGSMECMVWYKPRFLGRKQNVALQLLSEGLGRAKSPTIFPPANGQNQAQPSQHQTQSHAAKSIVPQPSTNLHNHHPTTEQTTSSFQPQEVNTATIREGLETGDEKNTSNGAGAKGSGLFSVHGIHGNSDLLSKAIERKSENKEKSEKSFFSVLGKFRRTPPTTESPSASPKQVANTLTPEISDPRTENETKDPEVLETRTEKGTKNTGNVQQNVGELPQPSTKDQSTSQPPPTHTMSPTTKQSIDMPELNETPDLIGPQNHRYAQQDAVFVRQCVRAELAAQKARRGLWGIEPPKPNPAMRVPIVPRTVARITRTVKSFLPKF